MSSLPGARRTQCRVRTALLLAAALGFSTPRLFASSRPTEPAEDVAAKVLIVVGAQGEEQYGTNFARQATLWQKACLDAKCSSTTIGLTDSSSTNDFEALKSSLEAEGKESAAALWLVLIGHGTFDGKEARFNLRGPDVSATDLAAWLKPFHRPMAIVDTSSSSAPFLNKLSATNRVIITATRSGNEQNFARFGQYFAEAISDSGADLDKDGEISLLEAFLVSARRVAEFYKTEGRLATEHALLDDNGDGLGTQADWFQGLRAIKKPQGSAAVDGLLAQQFHLGAGDAEAKFTTQQRSQLDALERAVLLHREKKSQMPEAQYYQELEKLLLDLARFYEPIPDTSATVPASLEPSKEGAQQH